MRTANDHQTGTQDPELAAHTSDRTLALAVLRGCLLDLLATGDTERVGAAVTSYLRLTAGQNAER